MHQIGVKLFWSQQTFRLNLSFWIWALNLGAIQLLEKVYTALESLAQYVLMKFNIS